MIRNDARVRRGLMILSFITTVLVVVQVISVIQGG